MIGSNDSWQNSSRKEPNIAVQKQEQATKKKTGRHRPKRMKAHSIRKNTAMTKLAENVCVGVCVDDKFSSALLLYTPWSVELKK